MKFVLHKLVNLMDSEKLLRIAKNSKQKKDVKQFFVKFSG